MEGYRPLCRMGMERGVTRRNLGNSSVPQTVPKEEEGGRQPHPAAWSGCSGCLVNLRGNRPFSHTHIISGVRRQRKKEKNTQYSL